MLETPLRAATITRWAVAAFGASALSAAAFLVTSSPASARGPGSAGATKTKRSSFDNRPKLLLLGAAGVLYAYDLRGNLLSQSQLSDGTGSAMCSDGHTYIVVLTASGNAEEFPIGATQPSLTMDVGQPALFTGYACAVAPNGDVVFGGAIIPTANAGLETFLKGASEPYELGGFQAPSVFSGLAIDASGAPWAVGSYFLNYYGPSPVIASGSPYWNRLPGFYYPQSDFEPAPAGVGFDRSNNLVVEDPYNQELVVYPGEHLTGCPACSMRLSTRSLGPFVFSPNGHEVFVIDTSGKVYGYRYPVDGPPNVTINLGAVGIALIEP
jgi:hypothetical protein